MGGITKSCPLGTGDGVWTGLIVATRLWGDNGWNETPVHSIGNATVAVARSRWQREGLSSDEIGYGLCGIGGFVRCDGLRY